MARIVLVTSMLVGLCARSRSAEAQSTVNDIPFTENSPDWSPVRRLPDSQDRIGTPLLLADSEGTVYTFVTEEPSGSPQVILRKWRLDEGWDPAVDITAPERISEICAARLDARGTIHLLIHSVVGNTADLLYTRVHSSEADKAGSWSEPEVLGSGLIEPYCAIEVSPQGQLAALFNSNRHGTIGNGLLAVVSEDWGATWSEPDTVFETETVDTYPGVVRSTLDERGRMHAVWSEWRPPMGGEKIYYASMDPDTLTWDAPTLLLDGAEYDNSGDWAEIVHHDGAVLVFALAVINETLAQYMFQSLDGGSTWSAPVRAFPGLYGGNGNVAAVVDGLGRLHAVFCNRTQATQIHGAWHSRWLGSAWSPATPIVSAPKSQYFDPTIPEAVVVRGNVIFAVWRMDGAPGAFYSYRVLEDVPELPSVAVPTAASEPRFLVPAWRRPMPARKPTQAPTTHLSVESDAAFRSSQRSPMLPTIVGTLAAGLLITFAIVRRRPVTRPNRTRRGE